MIAICPNPYRDEDLNYTRRAMSMLSKEGFPCAVCPVFADEGEEILPKDLTYLPLQELANH